MRRILSGLLCLVLALGLLAGCGDAAPNGIKKKKVDRPDFESGLSQLAGPQDGDTIAIFDTTEGEIRAVLFPDKAPMAVENFTGLAQQGFYDGKPFHRVLYGFVAQSGDADGTGLSGRTIWKNNPYPKEPSADLRHFPGALCVAFSPEQEVSGGSQFYFVQALPGNLDEAAQQKLAETGCSQDVVDAYKTLGGLPYLDFTDTVFGQVYQGMKVIDSIAMADTDENGHPTEDVLVKSVTIETYQAG